MSEHTDHITHSDAVSNLRMCVELLRALPQMDWEIEETQDLITRLTAVTRNVLGRLTIADRNLVPSNAVDDLEGPSQRILEIVKSLKDSAPSVDINLPDADNQIDEILAAASALPVLPIRTTSEVLEKAAEQFDREASSARAAISAEVDSLRTEIADFHQSIQEATTDFNNNLAEFKELVDQRAAEAQSTAESLLARIDGATERLQRDVTSIQETFRASQSRQSAEFEESQNQRITDFTADQETRDREFHERLDSTIEDIERFRDEANKMLEEVAGASTAAHYVGHSQQQNKTADIWRWIGVGSLFAMALASVWVFYESSRTEQDFSFAWLIARTGLLGSILILGAYALRQSSNHRRQAENMGRLANELQLLWPFMNRLPSEHKEALLLEITPLYFRGQSSEDPRIDRQGLARKLLDKLGKARVEGE